MMEQMNTFKSRHTKNIIGREITYTVPRGLYNSFFSEAKIKVDPQTFIDYINQTEGFLGTVTELHIEG